MTPEHSFWFPPDNLERNDFGARIGPPRTLTAPAVATESPLQQELSRKHQGPRLRIERVIDTLNELHETTYRHLS